MKKKNDRTTWLLACCVSIACAGDDDTSLTIHPEDPPTVSDGTQTSADTTGDGGDTDPDDGTSASTTSPSTTSPSTTSEDDTGDDTGESSEVPPTGARAILPWLEAGSYADWPAESAVHPSTGPHGEVRTFVNQTLYDSMAAGATVHPADSASVKELYSGDTMIGWAVSLRLDDGPGEDAWYWYELLNGSVIADGTNVALCANCHAGGDDYVLTPYPLQ